MQDILQPPYGSPESSAAGAHSERLKTRNCLVVLMIITNSSRLGYDIGIMEKYSENYHNGGFILLGHSSLGLAACVYSEHAFPSTVAPSPSVCTNVDS